MGKWDDKILSAADKITKGIEKGADYVVNLRTPPNGIKLQSSQNDAGMDQRAKHCPSCGYTVGTLDMFCPACGSSLEDSKVSSAAQILSNNLMMIDSQKEGLVRNLIRNHQGNVSDKATQKATMIKSYPIPNTKKDLLEFMHMAASGINSKLIAGVPDPTLTGVDTIRTEKLLSQTWLDKMEGIYQKAKALLASDPDFAKIEAIYAAKKAEIQSYCVKVKKSNKKAGRIFLIILLALILGGGALFYFIGYKPHLARIERLNSLVVEIRQDVKDGKYAEAFLLTNYVRLNDGFSSDADTEWNHKRNELVREIEKAIEERKIE